MQAKIWVERGLMGEKQRWSVLDRDKDEIQQDKENKAFVCNNQMNLFQMNPVCFLFIQVILYQMSYHP